MLFFGKEINDRDSFCDAFSILTFQNAGNILKICYNTGENSVVRMPPSSFTLFSFVSRASLRSDVLGKTAT
jgi:hypothetical protein